MKSRPAVRDEDLTSLAEVLTRIDGVDDMRAFLTDLCTPAELEALTDRWRVVPLLAQGVSYRQIHQLTAVSVTTIGRVARHLEHGAGGYTAALALHQYPIPAESRDDTSSSRDA